jgi:hypothetical protein
METAEPLNKQVQRKNSSQRVRSGSFMEDIVNTTSGTVNILESQEPDSIELQKEITQMNVTMAVEYLSSLSKLSQLTLKSIDKNKIKGIVDSLKQKKVQLEEYTKTSEYTRKADKVYYVVGCILTFLTTFIIAKFPGTYYFHWLVFVETALFMKRYALYKS